MKSPEDEEAWLAALRSAEADQPQQPAEAAGGDGQAGSDDEEEEEALRVGAAWRPMDAHGF